MNLVNSTMSRRGASPGGTAGDHHAETNHLSIRRVKKDRETFQNHKKYYACLTGFIGEYRFPLSESSSDSMKLIVDDDDDKDGITL